MMQAIVPLLSQLAQQITPSSWSQSVPQHLLALVPVEIPLLDMVPTSQDCPRPIELPTEGAPRSPVVE